MESPLLPPGSCSSPPCASLCCLHGAWQQLQELCKSFPVLCLKFLLGIMNRMCLVLSPWLQRHLSIGLSPRLVSVAGSERSQTRNEVFARRAAEGRLPHMELAASLGVPCPRVAPEASPVQVPAKSPTIRALLPGQTGRELVLPAMGYGRSCLFPSRHFGNVPLNPLAARKSISHPYKVRMSRQE